MRGNNAVYGTKKLAQFFGVTERTVLGWCRKGKLPAFKIGKKWRVRAADLQKMISGKVHSRRNGSPPRLL